VQTGLTSPFTGGSGTIYKMEATLAIR